MKAVIFRMELEGKWGRETDCIKEYAVLFLGDLKVILTTPS